MKRASILVALALLTAPTGVHADYGRSSSRGSTRLSLSSHSSSSSRTYPIKSGCGPQSLLRIFGANATCGRDGWTFDTIVNGQCPISACIINVRRRPSAFGYMD